MNHTLNFSKAVSKEKLKEYLTKKCRVEMESSKFKPIKKHCLNDPKFDCDYNNKNAIYFTTGKLMTNS